MIRLDNVSKYYYSKGVIASGFSKVSIEFNLGEFVAIVGESGSGKSTLLNVISGLDSYEEGEMYVNGLETSHFTEKDLEDYRRKYVGNIFQNFNLVNSYTVYQNIELVLLLNGNKKKDVKKKVIELIKKVNLYKFRNTKVSKLSGGQKQRVAIARALAKDTPLIIADEPTGNLDSKSAAEVIETLHQISKDKLVIIVTHNFEQVEKYVTRVVKMHDGKILEDKVIKEAPKEVNVKEAQFKNITFFNKVRLAFRNTFNILPKFLLIFLVYAFITVCCIGQYAINKEQNYKIENSGYNNVFSNTSNDRIVIKKKDNSIFTEDDYKKIEKITNVDYVNKYDLLIDYGIDFFDKKQDNWFYSLVYDVSIFKGDLLRGRLPKEDNEILLVIDEDSFSYYDDNLDDILDDYLQHSYSENKYKVVGISKKVFKSDVMYFSPYEFEIYANDNTVQNIYYDILSRVYYENDYYIDNKKVSDGFLSSIYTSDKIPSGQVYISNSNNYLCSYDYCVNKNLTIKVKEPNYADSLSLNISKVYYKYNFKELTGMDNYEYNNGVVIINTQDYNNLFKKGIYQSSVFVKDEHEIEEVVKELDKIGIDALLIKDTLVNEGETQIMAILYTIITIILLVSIFYVSYFVISLILKSRKVYFSTIRILGANKKISKDLLIYELIIDSNIAYFLYVLLVVLTKNGIITSSYIKNEILGNVLIYLHVPDFVVLYVVLNLLSLLISLRFAKKLFKKSIITTMNEEV